MKKLKFRLVFTISWSLTIMLLHGQNAPYHSPVDSIIRVSANYYAPKSGEVYLVWKPLNISHETAQSLNKSAQLTDGLFYSSMEGKGDTFSVALLLPEHTQLYSCFWITKDKASVYQDYWDTRSGSTVTITADFPTIKKRANYQSTAPNEVSFFNRHRWKIAILLLIGYMVMWFLRRRLKVTPLKDYFSQILAVGLGLNALHLLVRFEITRMHPRWLWNHPEEIIALLMAARYDIAFVFLFTFFFIGLDWVARNTPLLRRYLFYTFLVFAGISALIAYINIDVVNHLGGPLTYQWVYYADFLNSTTGLVSIKATASFGNGLSLLLYLLLLPLVVGMLLIITSLAFGKKRIPLVLVSFLLLLTLTAYLLPSPTPESIPKGRYENAVFTFLSSVVSTQESRSIFSSQATDAEAFISENASPISPSATPVASSPEVKNIVFIVLESAGANYFDLYGGEYDITPNLNRYAQNALRFENAYANMPSSNRSLASLSCGIYPYPSYQSLTNEKPTAVFPSLPSVLRPLGYRNSFFSSADFNWQNCLEFLRHRQYDVVEHYTDVACDAQFRMNTPTYEESGGIDDMCLADRFRSWLAEAPERPFSSILWTVQGHYPYYFAGQETDYGVNNVNFNRYLNALRHDDALIGQVMGTLETQGLDSTTLVVVVGDHGEVFGQHGQYGHGNTIYEENIRVPLLFINPVLFNGETRDDFAALKDIPSTALSLINVKIPPEWQGRDLSTSSSKEVFSFCPYTKYYFGYRKDNWKYIFDETDGLVEVFDLANDPLENNNLASTHSPDSVAYARKRIGAWVRHQQAFIKRIEHEQQ